MKDHRVGLRYAQALFGLAESEGRLEVIHSAFLETLALVDKHQEIGNLLMNTTIARDEKEDFLEKILPQGTPPLMVNFSKVLVRKRRFENLRLIAEKFEDLYEAKKGIQRVRVESPIMLDQALETKLRSALEKMTGRQVLLETTVNPELLGGLVLDFEGKQIDGSFRTALYELKQKLLR